MKSKWALSILFITVSYGLVPMAYAYEAYGNVASG